MDARPLIYGGAVRVVPVVLQSSILAGAMLFPVAVLLAAAAVGGALGLRIGAVVLSGALLYAVIVWLFARRGEAEELRHPSPAPEDATPLSLARMALRGLLLLAGLAVLAALAGQFDLIVVPLILAAGFGLAEARVATRFAAWERRHPGRLVRDAQGVLRVF